MSALSEPAAPASQAKAVLARGHLTVLDAYRALAATAVVATHVGFQTGQTMQGQFGAVLARFDLGVALFFALSGFLLYRPWAVALETGRHGPALLGYLWHRGLRILPAYWVVVVVALTTLPDNAGTSATTWVANLALVQIYVPATISPGLTQMWSLSTEVAFYLVLPALAWVASAIARRYGSPLAAASTLAVVLVGCNIAWSVWIHSGDRSELLDFWLPNFLSWFAVGILLAAAVAHVAAGRSLPRVLHAVVTLSRQPGPCWTAALGLLLVASTPVAGPRAFESLPDPAQGVTKNLLYAAIVGLVLLPATLGPQTGRFHAVFSARPLRQLGDISYGIFLWHLVVLAAIFEVTDRPVFTGGFWPVFTLTLLGTLAVAAASWVVLERPALRLKSRVPLWPLTTGPVDD